MKRRKLCVITGSRAEYGLLHPLLSAIQDDRALVLQLVVTGAHLAEEFGKTCRQIEKDGFRIHARVPILTRDASVTGITNSLAAGIVGFGRVFQADRPDMVIVLGDRYEIFSAAQAAMMARIPIAHLHGGEATEGLIDEAIRHSITKMSHFHFVAAREYRQRVIQLGEHPSRVFHYGAPGLDQITRTPCLTKAELERELGATFGEQNFLVTYHPVTLSEKSIGPMMKNLFRALDRFPKSKIFWTQANADLHGLQINKRVQEFSEQRPGRVAIFASLGTRKYLNLMRHADVVIGNSSSGIIEAPVLKVATVNIGDRQQGRLMASSVICCGATEREIFDAIQQALRPSFRHKLCQTKSLYGRGGGISQRIKEKLKRVRLENVLFKRFYRVG